MKAASARPLEAAQPLSELRGQPDNLKAANAAGSDGAGNGDVAVPELTLQSPFRLHQDDVYHLADLARYHDQDFIHNAYRAILKRGPDAAGYQGFLDGLRNGRLNKVDVLARLRFSSEGRANKVRVDGMLPTALIRAAYRIPILGYLLNVAVGIARLPSAIRNQQRFENHSAVQLGVVAAHSNQLVHSINEIGRTLNSLGNALDLLRGDVREQERRIEELVSESVAAGAVVNERISELNNQLEDQFHAEGAKRRQQLSALRQDLREEIERLVQKQQQIVVDLESHNRRVNRLLDQTRAKISGEFDDQQMQVFFREHERGLDALYASFDEEFRGSREEIKERLRIYLPIIRAQSIGSDDMAILDLGCGRGEWLELLRDEQLHATGVEANRVLTGRCRELGLEVIEDDLVEYLRALPAASLGVVTGFHVVEHLAFEVLVEVLDEVMRVLRPRGLAIFETPNPQNVLVGSCNFYFDPTHRNPLPAPVLDFLLRSKGFQEIKLIKLNPSDNEPVAGDSEIVNRFNEYFYGAMDYAVVAWKP